ncbi:MAG: TetR/AcrR family transcriptional regulator [Oricola sp.]|jgi:AcrR family transcriptional regulator|nr:TetR/AcrR family transcriptional regulator [Oricola sp.]
MPSSTDNRAHARKSEIAGERSASAETDKALAAIVAHLEDLQRARPTVQICDGKTGRTKTTIDKILKAALLIFTRNGHAGLSLRKVAEEAGIAVGNLTYHFPTKDALIDAMMREALADYVEEHLEQFRPDRDEPIDILLNVVEFYVRNARESHQFFYQLWGFAGSSAEAREMVRELYRPIGRFVYYLVRAANPKLTDAEIRQAVLQIFSLEEGYKLFIGMGPDDSPAIRSAENDIRDITKRIIRAH